MKLIGNRSFDITVTLKRMMSGLPDLLVRVLVDPVERLVTLEVDAVDSALILDLISRILPQDHGVVAFTDDGAGWNPPTPPFGLRIYFDGRYFRGYVSKLMSSAYTLRIESSAGLQS